MTLRDRIENDPWRCVLIALFAGFMAGLGAYQGILEIADLKVVHVTQNEPAGQEHSISHRIHVIGNATPNDFLGANEYFVCNTKAAKLIIPIPNLPHNAKIVSVDAAGEQGAQGDKFNVKRFDLLPKDSPFANSCVEFTGQTTDGRGPYRTELGLTVRYQLSKLHE